MKIFLSLTVLFIPGLIFSQSSILLTNLNNSTTISPNAVINITVAPNATALNNIDIKNTSGSIKVYGVKRYSITLNSNGTSTAIPYFIYNGTQYPANISASSIQLTLTAGQSASEIPGPSYLIVHLDEISTAGFSQVKYTLFNTSNTSDSVQIICNYNASTAVKEQENGLLFFRIYTDEANNIISNITSGKNSEACLFIKNLSGSIIMRTKLNLQAGYNKSLISTDNMPPGIYFVSLKSPEGNFTVKLLVN